MNVFWALYRRDLFTAASTPLAYVFIAGFLAATAFFTIGVGGFFDAGLADLSIFFDVLPWAFAVFLPALAMRTWSEEVRSGTVETLFSLPAPTVALAFAKWLAAWTIAVIALVLTTPLWIAVSVLGAPDHGAILVGYLGAAVMAGAMLAMGCAISAITPNQTVAFVITALILVGLNALGLPAVTEAASAWIGAGPASALAGFSLIERFQALQRGVIDAPGVMYFAVVAWLGVAWTVLALDARRGV